MPEEVGHTDYYRFDWSLVEKKETGKKSVKVLAAFMFAGVSIIALLWVLNGVLGLATNEFFWLMTIFVVVVMAVVFAFYKQIGSGGDAKVWSYSLSKKGFEVNGKVYAVSDLDLKKNQDWLEENADVDWREIKEGLGGQSYLPVVFKRGSVKVIFPDDKTKARFVHAVGEYLKGLKSNS